MSEQRCKNPRCDKTPINFKNGKPRVFCTTECALSYNNNRKTYEPSDHNGVPWEEAPGVIKAKMLIAKRDRLPYEHRCRTCGTPIEHEVNMVTDGDDHYCGNQECYDHRLTPKSPNRKHRSLMAAIFNTAT